MKKIFSVPLYTGLDETQFADFKSFLKNNKDHVFDVYFTYPVPPFTEDAYGGVQHSKTSSSVTSDLEQVISIQEECDVKLSATFNNIHINPSNNNLKIFLKNFAPLYEAGIRSITLPFSSWVYSGEIQKKFPDVFIKNTVMWKLHSAREFWNAAEVGYDYVNLDRTLLRNYNILQEIHSARELFLQRTGKKVVLSILANEYPCSGFCPFREEHSSLAQSDQPGVEMFTTVFNICLFSHMKSKQHAGIKMNFLKMAFVPPWSEEFNEIMEFVDVYKMFGRIQRDYFRNSLCEIENHASGRGFLLSVRDQLEPASMLETEKGEKYQKLLKQWRKEIKNCNFNCWRCNLCDQVYENLPLQGRKTLEKYKLY